MFNDAGVAWNATHRQQLEGVVAKRLSGRYQPGRRAEGGASTSTGSTTSW